DFRRTTENDDHVSAISQRTFAASLLEMLVGVLHASIESIFERLTAAARPELRDERLGVGIGLYVLPLRGLVLRHQKRRRTFAEFGVLIRQRGESAHGERRRHRKSE